MARIREGKKSVLLVVDVQVGVMQNAWNGPGVIANIVKAVEKARANGIPVIWVQHADDELVINTPDWQLIPELLPAKGELQIHKNFNSAFEDTPLDEALANIGVTQIILAGAQTNWCIRATAYGALDRGYDLILIKDAHTTDTLEFGDGTKLEASDVVLDLNTTMNWLGYPGRTNHTVAVDDIDFSQLN